MSVHKLRDAKRVRRSWRDRVLDWLLSRGDVDDARRKRLDKKHEVERKARDLL